MAPHADAPRSTGPLSAPGDDPILDLDDRWGSIDGASLRGAVELDKASFFRVDLRGARELDLRKCRRFEGCLITDEQVMALASVLAQASGISIDRPELDQSDD